MSCDGCYDACCSCSYPVPCSTCPRLALVGSMADFPATPCTPPIRPWPKPSRCIRPWIPVSRTGNADPPPLCSIALDQPAINRIYEVRYFRPNGCGSFYPCSSFRTRVPPACAERLVPSKFMTMA